MRCSVTLLLPDGSHAELEPGDWLGRSATAAVPVDDPRISEAHAFVSLREGGFRLLALRRMVAVGGRPVAEVSLRPGVVFELADGLAFTVVSVTLPDRVWVIEAPGLPRAMLPSVCGVVGAPRPQLVGRPDPDCPVLVWASSRGYVLRAHGVDRLLADPDTFEVDGHPFRVRTVPVEGSGPGVTRVSGGVHAPLTVIASFDTAQIVRANEPPVLLPGIQARIVSELVAMGGPVSWTTLARELWPDDADQATLRRRWDVAVARLRRRLREERIRPDLVRSTGDGLVELVLGPGDRVEDRT